MSKATEILEMMNERKAPRAMLSTALKTPFQLVMDMMPSKLFFKFDKMLGEMEGKQNMFDQLMLIKEVTQDKKLIKKAQEMHDLMKKFQAASNDMEKLEMLMKESGLFKDFFDLGEKKESRIGQEFEAYLKKFNKEKKKFQDLLLEAEKLADSFGVGIEGGLARDLRFKVDQFEKSLGMAIGKYK